MLTVPVAPEHGFTSGLDSVTLVTWMVSVVARAATGEAVNTPPATAARVSAPSNDPSRFIANLPLFEDRQPHARQLMFAGTAAVVPDTTDADERRIASSPPLAPRGWRATCQASTGGFLRQREGIIAGHRSQPRVPTNPGRFPGGRDSSQLVLGDPAEAGSHVHAL